MIVFSCIIPAAAMRKAAAQSYAFDMPVDVAVAC
jgi:hypothetical protein